jgi:tetratricopeptide (TPR) repeat protein
MKAELAAYKSAARFQRRMRVIAQNLLFCLPLLALTFVHVNRLVAWAAGDNGTQSREARRPRANSQHERNDFMAAYELKGAANEEAAANDFAARYPASELRHYLYSSAMLQYQRENNPAKMLALGEKVLALDPDNPLALVLTATVVADALADHDRDREKKVGTIKRNATRAIHSAEVSYTDPSGDASGDYKTTLQSMAYSALGIMKLKTGDDAGAEKDLKIAADMAKVRPDARIWYHLALAQDHRKKYAAALSSVQQALQLASSDSELQRQAEAEHERLAGMTKGPRSASPSESQ